jgi:FkbM family methyltransferase
MNVPEMIIKYGLKPTGVIQVGSHHGEEIPTWDELGIPHVHFEPIRSNWRVLKQITPHAVAFNMALGSKAGYIEMRTETVNGGQSCSCLNPKRHLDLFPWVVFDTREVVLIMRLDSIDYAAIHDLSPYNFMYIDVQGYELEVLKGAENTLIGIEFIFAEVNRAEVFEGCAKVEEVDNFLSGFGFKRVETEWHGGEFGDALFIRNGT